MVNTLSKVSREVAKTHQDHLQRIKKNVESYYDYFKDNYRSWHLFKKFLYVSSLNESDLQVLRELGKPELEFNILEAYVSRQKGEFSKQVPSISAEPSDNALPIDIETTQVVEGYMRHMEQEMRETNSAYRIYDDMLSGGFSCAKVYTKYAHDLSFDQNIVVERVFDPTLCGFDPLAVNPDKGDGEYAFEVVPMRTEDFKEKFPKIDISNLRYSNNLDKFSWSYRNNNEKLILVCSYYEKKKKRVKIVKLSNNQVMVEDDYYKFISEWELSGHIEQVPTIVSERKSYIQTIDRYIFIENNVLEFKHTDYGLLPLVFYDGDSVSYRESLQGELKQITRPYIYQAKGIQQLKNYSAQTLANEIENMVQHKWKAPIEGIPPEYKDAYIDPQTAQVIVYNQFKDDDPNKRLDPPQEVARVPTPPEVMAVFQSADQATQNILGTYDAALGIQKQQLSGVAIVEGATQSNATAMPYIVGYLAGFAQTARVALDLITKYYKTPRTIPIIDKDGERKFININDNGQPSMDFHPHALNIVVKAGVNFSIQKSRAVQQITALMQASPIFAQFINSTPEGLRTLLDNIEMRGIDYLKDSVEEFLEKNQQVKAQQAQMAMQNDPKVQRVQLDKAKFQHQIKTDIETDKKDVADLAIKDKNADTSRMKVLFDAGDSESNREMRQNEIDAENARTAVDMYGKSVDKAIQVADMSHKHRKDMLGMEKNI